MSPVTVPGAEVQVGDDLLDIGRRPHRVTAIEPYDVRARLGLDQDGWRIARCLDGYSITLPPQQPFPVGRIPVSA